MTDEPIFWYQLNPAQRAAVASRFRGDPLSSLGFSRRVYNALGYFLEVGIPPGGVSSL